MKLQSHDFDHRMAGGHWQTTRPKRVHQIVRICPRARSVCGGALLVALYSMAFSDTLGHSVGNIDTVGHSVGDMYSVGHPVVDLNTVGHSVGDIDTVGHSMAYSDTVGHTMGNTDTAGHCGRDRKRWYTPLGTLVQLDTVGDIDTMGHTVGDIAIHGSFGNRAENWRKCRSLPVTAREADMSRPQPGEHAQIRHTHSHQHCLCHPTHSFPPALIVGPLRQAWCVTCTETS